MPFTTTWTPDGLGILRQGEAIVTAAEILAGDLALLEAPAQTSRLRYALVDFSSTSRLEVSADDVRAIAEQGAQIAALTPTVAIALVAPSDGLYGVVRMWEAHTDGVGWETWVFRDRAAAVAWLRERVPGAVLES